MNLKVFFPYPIVSSPSFLKVTYARFASSVVSAVMLGCCSSPTSWAKDISWDALNLTSQQETQMEQLENNWEKTHQEVNGQIGRDMAELKNLLPTGDTQRIRDLQNRIMTNKMYLMNESMNTFLKKRDMLTPTQRAQLQRMIPCKSGTAP